MKYIVLLMTLGLIILAGCSSNHIYVKHYDYEELSPEERSALDAALMDEYKALTTYQWVIRDLGEVTPFTNIVKAEQKHIDLLIELYDKYELEPLTNSWYNKVEHYTSKEEACSAAVIAEEENSALYEELKSKVDNEDILAVFNHLQSASSDKHLLAFQRCGDHE